jgi:drug/metabolite transporter (DMT)-like permease
MRAGFLYIMIAVIGYSFLPVWLNNLTPVLPPVSIALWRFAFAALTLGGAALLRECDRPARLRRGWVMLMGVLMAPSAVAAFYGLTMIPVGTYVVVFYTYPAMVAVIAALMGERLSLWGYIALALTMLGVAVTAGNISLGGSDQALIGVLLALANALFVAIYYIASGRVLRGTTTFARAAFYTALGAFTSLALVSLFTGLSTPPTFETWLWLLMLALVSTVLPIFTLNAGIQRLGASRAAIVGTVEPLISAGVAFLALGQPLTPEILLGGAIIVCSVILLQTRGTVAQPAAAPMAGD